MNPNSETGCGVELDKFKLRDTPHDTPRDTPLESLHFSRDCHINITRKSIYHHHITVYYDEGHKEAVSTFAFFE